MTKYNRVTNESELYQIQRHWIHGNAISLDGHHRSLFINEAEIRLKHLHNGDIVQRTTTEYTSRHQKPIHHFKKIKGNSYPEPNHIHRYRVKVRSNSDRQLVVKLVNQSVTIPLPDSDIKNLYIREGDMVEVVWQYDHVEQLRVAWNYNGKKNQESVKAIDYRHMSLADYTNQKSLVVIGKLDFIQKGTMPGKRPCTRLLLKDVRVKGNMTQPPIEHLWVSVPTNLRHFVFFRDRIGKWLKVKGQVKQYFRRTTGDWAYGLNMIKDAAFLSDAETKHWEQTIAEG